MIPSFWRFSLRHIVASPGVLTITISLDAGLSSSFTIAISPLSISGAMLLSHIGYQEQADKLYAALDECTVKEKKLVITGREDGATGDEFADYILSKID